MANDILLFADDTGANVLTQVAYAADTQRTLGNQAGIARSAFVNKVLRQTSFMSVALAQLIVDRTTQSVLDDGNDAVLLANLKSATDVAFNTNAATAKTTPIDADLLPIVDSAASNVLKKLSWLNLKATLKTYFDTLYSTLGSGGSKIQPISASVAANALTVTLNATSLHFKSGTIGSGTVNTRTIASPISMTVSSGSTLGTISATASRLVLIAIDNAGTVELAIVNLAGGNNLDETTLISTIAEGGAGAADSASIIYSTTARTGVPFRVVGFIEITEATAGTWATAPSTIQGSGGQNIIQAGNIIQVANYTTGTMATGTTTIPLDNTIPQITEGTQFMSLAFSPKKANSKLKIDVVFHSSHSSANAWLMACIFKDSGVNSIGAGASSETVATYGNGISFSVEIDAVDTALKTFTVRGGSNQAGTMTFNGASGVQLLGGVMASSITITETAQ